MKELLNEFKTFILRGNVLDLAVAVVVGTAFNAVVNSFANDVVMNAIAAIFGQPSFDSIKIEIGDGAILVGKFLTALLNFLIIAASVFLVVKVYETAQRRRKRDVLEGEEDTATLTDEALLLTEIRDLLAGRPAGDAAGPAEASATQPPSTP